MTIIRKGVAEAKGWQGFPVELELTTTRGKPEKWKTKAYWILLKDRQGKVYKILAYSVELITMRLNYVEVNGLAKLFQKIKSLDITWLSGQIILLIGMEDV